MKKLIEWILYSLDIEMAQKLPIAVSGDWFFFTTSMMSKEKYEILRILLKN